VLLLQEVKPWVLWQHLTCNNSSNSGSLNRQHLQSTAQPLLLLQMLLFV
jgi:hypothetical protein